jgi:hypothetical protein
MNGNSTGLKIWKLIYIFQASKYQKQYASKWLHENRRLNYGQIKYILYILRILKNLKIKITVVTTNNHPADPLEPTNLPLSDAVASTNIPQVIQKNLH